MVLRGGAIPRAGEVCHRLCVTGGCGCPTRRTVCQQHHSASIARPRQCCFDERDCLACRSHSASRRCHAHLALHVDYFQCRVLRVLEKEWLFDLIETHCERKSKKSGLACRSGPPLACRHARRTSQPHSSPALLSLPRYAADTTSAMCSALF